MATLREAIENGHARLFVIIRIDFSDLLINLCREVDSGGGTFNLGNVHILKSFRRDQAIGVVREIFAPLISENGQLEVELDRFGTALVEDLLQPPRDPRLSREDEKTVLPAELQMAGQMIESFGLDHFTAAKFREYGGRRGLLKAYVDNAKAYVSRKAAVPTDRALLALRELVPEHGGRIRSAKQVAEALGMPVNQATSVLDAFCELKLVNQVPNGLGESESGTDASPNYELMHEHLGQMLQEAVDPELRETIDARQRIRFWQDRTQRYETLTSGSPLSGPSRWLRTAFAQPVPVMEVLRLWRAARLKSERRMLIRSARAFATKVAVVIAPLVLAVLWTYSDAYQIRAVINDPLPLDLDALMGRGPSNDDDAGHKLRVVDEWLDALIATGHTRQAQASIDRAHSEWVARNYTDAPSSFIGTFLAVKAAELHIAVGNQAELHKALEQATRTLDGLKQSRYPNLRFAAAASVAETLAKAGETKRAVDHWESAVDLLESFAVNSSYWLLVTARGLAAIDDRPSRDALWQQVIAGVTSGLMAPDNVIALGGIAAEFYRQGERARAERLLEQTLQTVRTFQNLPLRSTATKSTLDQQSGRTRSTWTDPKPVIDHYVRGNVRIEQAYAYLYIAAALADAGWDRALPIWTEALGTAAMAEASDEVDESRDSTVKPDTVDSNRFYYVDPVLAFYETAASMFHRRTAKDVQRVAEERISDFATKQRGHPHFRARALAVSAGRLLHLDPEASERAWRAAVAAATEVRDSDRPEPTRQLDTTFQADAFLPADPVLKEMELVSSDTKNVFSRRIVMEGLVRMLIHRQTDAPVLLRALKTASDEQPRYRLFTTAIGELIDQGDFDGAAAVIGGMRTDALGQVSQTDREDGLWRVALFEAELGRLRQARLTCPNNDRMKLECYTRILEAYQRRRDPAFAKVLEKRVCTLSGVLALLGTAIGGRREARTRDLRVAKAIGQ